MGQSTPIQYDEITGDELLEELFAAIEELVEMVDALREGMEDEEQG